MLKTSLVAFNKKLSHSIQVIAIVLAIVSIGVIDVLLGVYVFSNAVLDDYSAGHFIKTTLQLGAYMLMNAWLMAQLNRGKGE